MDFHIFKEGHDWIATVLLDDNTVIKHVNESAWKAVSELAYAMQEYQGRAFDNSEVNLLVEPEDLRQDFESEFRRTCPHYN